MQGLRFFSRTSARGSWNLASYHSPHSMTWRWLIGFSMFRGDEARVRPLLWSYRDNNGLQWGFRIPWVGIVRWAQQRPMWFRDVYYRNRGEVEDLRAELSRPRPNSPPRSPFQPTVIDGGQSVH